jgi:hypothetical protein
MAIIYVINCFPGPYPKIIASCPIAGQKYPKKYNGLCPSSTRGAGFNKELVTFSPLYFFTSL